MLLNEFKNWLLDRKYKENTATDYQGRIERLCKQENITLENLVQNINSILPIYEDGGEKYMYGRRSHTSVKQALRRFNVFLMEGGR